MSEWVCGVSMCVCVCVGEMVSIYSGTILMATHEEGTTVI